jgi:glucose-1-phosphatase
VNRIPLLDLGNVVVKVDFAPFFSWIAERSGGGDPRHVEKLLVSSLFYDFEAGSLSREGFARRFSKLYGLEFSPAEFEERFCGIFPGVVDGMDSLLDELAGAGPVYCLSNTNEVHLEFLRARFPVMNKFTRIFASHEMGKRKPYPGIYRDVARDLDLPPASLLFFDDLQSNVAGALRAGLEARVFTGAEGVRAAFKPKEKVDDNAQREGVSNGEL